MPFSDNNLFALMTNFCNHYLHIVIYEICMHVYQFHTWEHVQIVVPTATAEFDAKIFYHQ